MMFVVHCKDKAGHLQTRLDHRPAHLAYLDGYKENLIVAGPLLSEDRQNMVGSHFILDFPDRAALDIFLANDPYRQAELFEKVEVTPFRKLLPA